MAERDKIEDLKTIINNKKLSPTQKLPAYAWQELALKVIKELKIPPKKRNSIFKVCKEHPKYIIEECLSDTKELCQTGEKWKYFFKLINQNKK